VGVYWLASWLQNLFVYSLYVRNHAMDIPLTLTIEQEFNLKVYEDQVLSLSQDQAKEYLLEVMRQLMIKDNVIRHLLKQA
jgi:hypothetical protein